MFVQALLKGLGILVAGGFWFRTFTVRFCSFFHFSKIPSHNNSFTRGQNKTTSPIRLIFWQGYCLREFSSWYEISTVIVAPSGGQAKYLSGRWSGFCPWANRVHFLNYLLLKSLMSVSRGGLESMCLKEILDHNWIT